MHFIKFKFTFYSLSFYEIFHEDKILNYFLPQINFLIFLFLFQVATSTGVMSHYVSLQVVVPEAFILGSGELHVDMGSALNLVCIIEKVIEAQFDDFVDNEALLQSPTPPQYVYWQRNSHMINYDDSRRDVSIETTPGPRTQSRLIIREPQISDSGNYTCSASNTEPASIYVFVSKGNRKLR